jgi:hypothetical protein
MAPEMCIKNGGFWDCAFPEFKSKYAQGGYNLREGRDGDDIQLIKCLSKQNVIVKKRAL